MDCWECSLRYCNCHVHDLLIMWVSHNFFLFILESDQTTTLFTMAAIVMHHLQTTKIILKKVICLPTIETGSLTGTKILFQSSIYMSIQVVIGIVCFSLSILKLWLLEKFTQTQCLPDATCSGETPSTILPTTKIAQYMHIIAMSH